MVKDSNVSIPVFKGTQKCSSINFKKKFISFPLDNDLVPYFEFHSFAVLDFINDAIKFYLDKSKIDWRSYNDLKGGDS